MEIETTGSMLSECGNGHLQPIDHLIPFSDIDDLHDRISPGEAVPEGECKHCGALAHRVMLTFTDMTSPNYLSTKVFGADRGGEPVTCDGCETGWSGHRAMLDGESIGVVCLIALYFTNEEASGRRP